MDEKSEHNMSKYVDINRLRNILEGTALSADDKHRNMYDEFGYWLDIEQDRLKELTIRNALAFSAIDQTVNKTWLTPPEIVEPSSRDKIDTAIEKRVNAFIGKHLHSLKELDRRTLINEFSAGLIVIKDGQTLDRPVKSVTLESIVEIKPIWQHQLTVEQRDENRKSPTFGQPLMWNFEEPILDQDNEESGESIVKIHASRIIIFSEYGLGSGMSRLTVAVNGALDGQKTAGSASEGFWKQAARHISINFDPTADIGRMSREAGGDIHEQINEDIGSLNSGFDKAVVTKGAEVSTIQSDINDPHSTFMISATMVGMPFNIPMTKLIGQQTGRLASDEDETSWSQYGDSRRLNTVNRYIRTFMSWLFDVKALELFEYEIKWQSLTEPKIQDKLENAERLSKINSEAFNVTGKQAFTLNEIRIMAGFEPIAGLDDIEPDEDTEGNPDENPQD